MRLAVVQVASGQWTLPWRPMLDCDDCSESLVSATRIRFGGIGVHLRSQHLFYDSDIFPVLTGFLRSTARVSVGDIGHSQGSLRNESGFVNAPYPYICNSD